MKGSRLYYSYSTLEVAQINQCPKYCYTCYTHNPSIASAMNKLKVPDINQYVTVSDVARFFDATLQKQKQNNNHQYSAYSQHKNR